MNEIKPLMIKLWKLLQILNIISAILYLILFFIKKELFYSVIEKVTSTGFPLFLIITLDILSIIILIGIKEKAKFGYYVSVIFLFIIILSSLIDLAMVIKKDLVFPSILYLVQIFLLTVIGFSIYKERDYFGIKK